MVTYIVESLNSEVIFDSFFCSCSLDESHCPGERNKILVVWSVYSFDNLQLIFQQEPYKKHRKSSSRRQPRKSPIGHEVSVTISLAVVQLVYRQCTHIIAEFRKGHQWNRNYVIYSCQQGFELIICEFKIQHTMHYTIVIAIGITTIRVFTVPAVN